MLVELDQVPVVPLRRRHRLIGVVEGRFAERMIVPFDAGHLAGLAADAGRDVDVLADFLLALRALAGHGPGMGRDFLNLKCSAGLLISCASVLSLFELHQEALELRRVGIGIDRRRRQVDSPVISAVLPSSSAMPR